MKKRYLLLPLLLLLGFYVIWPVWSGYRIFTALRDQNVSLLASKIDFDRVRTSLRPSISSEVEREADKMLAQNNIPANLAAGLKKEMMPRVIDTAMSTIVTPESVLRIYREGGDVAGSVRRIMAEQMQKTGGIGGLLGGGNSGGGGRGGLGGLIGGAGGLGSVLGGLAGKGGTQEAPAPAVEAKAQASGGKPQFGFANIKGFGLDGLIGLKVGVARDPLASGPDLLAGMSFSGFDWKLTKLELHR